MRSWRFVLDSKRPGACFAQFNYRDVVSISTLLEMCFCAVAMCLYSGCDVTDISVTWIMTSYDFLSHQNGRGPTDAGYKRRDFLQGIQLLPDGRQVSICLSDFVTVQRYSGVLPGASLTVT